MRSSRTHKRRSGIGLGTDSQFSNMHIELDQNVRFAARTSLRIFMNFFASTRGYFHNEPNIDTRPASKKAPPHNRFPFLLMAFASRNQC
jgi:hypothetical protein